jgi:hypothetical protein
VPLAPHRLHGRKRIGIEPIGTPLRGKDIGVSGWRDGQQTQQVNIRPPLTNASEA